jgi:hypothetical protein
MTLYVLVLGYSYSMEDMPALSIVRAFCSRGKDIPRPTHYFACVSPVIDCVSFNFVCANSFFEGLCCTDSVVCCKAFQWICDCCAIDSLCIRFAIDLLSLSGRFAFDLYLLCNHFAINQIRFAVFLLCYHFALTLLD